MVPGGFRLHSTLTYCGGGQGCAPAVLVAGDVVFPAPGTLLFNVPVELGAVPAALGVVTGEVSVGDVFVVALLGAVPADVVPAVLVPGALVEDVLVLPTPVAPAPLPTLPADVVLGTHGRVGVLLLIPVGVVVVPPIGVVLGIVVLVLGIMVVVPGEVPGAAVDVPGVVVLLGRVVLLGVVAGLCGVVAGLCGVVDGLCMPGVVVAEAPGVAVVDGAVPALPAWASAIPAVNSTAANKLVKRVFIHPSLVF